MKRIAIIGMALAAGAFLLASAAMAQPTKRTQTAVITAPELEYNWDTDLFVFSGGVKLTISGPTQATMTAPKISVEFTQQANQVNVAEAIGQTHFTVTTAPDTTGARRTIEATSNGGATYHEGSQVVTLTGGVKADMRVEPASRGISAAHLESDTVTANLGGNDFDFIGNATVAIAGANDASMSAPRISLGLTTTNEVAKLHTTGATQLKVFTAPDTKGQRRRISASGEDGATYDQSTQLAVLNGNATADITLEPPASNMQGAHLEGEQITADLANRKIKVTQATVEVSTAQ